MVLMPDQKVGVQRIFIWKSVEVGRIYRVETNTYNGKYGKRIWYLFLVWWNVWIRKIFMMGGDKGDGA